MGRLGRAVGGLLRCSDPGAIRKLAVAVHALDNEAGAIHRAAVEGLLADGLDARELVWQKHMFFFLETGVDRCEDAMDAVRPLVVKPG